MAIGVPETDVFAAADRVLARGERPTVERVRAELGRGSPARVGQLLEQWWETLTQRLAGETRLPALPSDIATAFTAVWASAVAHAEQSAASALRADQEQLASARADIARERDQWRAELAATRIASDQVTATCTALEERLAELQRLSHQQTTAFADLTQQRDALSARLGEFERLNERLAAEVRDRERALTTSSAEHIQHLRAVENRAHVEVDRAREDAKAISKRLDLLTREAAAVHRSTQSRWEKAESTLRDMTVALAAQKARADALEKECGRRANLAKAVSAGNRPKVSGIATAKKRTITKHKRT